MNQPSKSAIKTLVLALRHLLEDDLAIQLKRYGFAGERWIPVEKLPHIYRDDAAAGDYHRLKAALEQHLRRIGAAPGDATPAQRAEAVDWFVREMAFTHLNRLAALKVLEVRGLIPEVIATRDAYGGRSRAHYDYRNAHPDAAARSDDALPDAIRHTCRRVYTEFKFLFDVGDPAAGRTPPDHTLLWPTYPILKQCIDLINALDAIPPSPPLPLSPSSSLWAEDEIIGWLYQFYNAEHKEAVRARGRPRRPAEVAVINQFFTPRWIVKFLVDNTLGRLWLEMHPDSARVRTKCDYLVPEVLAEEERGRGGEGVRGSRGAEEHGRLSPQSSLLTPNSPLLTPNSPINTPHAPARRAAKPVTDIRLIDPACGTMHFGHYAFEVFQEMYRDSLEHGWPIEGSKKQEAGSKNPASCILHPASCTTLHEAEIPSLILRHNLYGVDIDLRAVQLAAFSLFIKAKRAQPDAAITSLNLVVADAVLPQDGARTEFLAQYADNRKVQDAVRQVLAEMENVAEVGSLLRVEERLRALLTAAGARVEGLSAGQRTLPGLEKPQMQLFEAAGADPEEWGAHYTLTRLLDDLRAFAARALQTHDLNAQLFAREAEKSVHLLDVFLNDYDVVVMNPPYGYTMYETRQYLKKVYKETQYDLYAFFIERATDLIGTTGYIGCLTSRTFLSLSAFEDLRRNLLLHKAPLVAMLDLGFGILDDATVETAATVLEKTVNLGRNITTFYRLNNCDVKENQLKRMLSGLDSEDIFWVSLERFRKIPGASLAYWTPTSIIQLFDKYEALQPTYGRAVVGLQTSDDTHFLRQCWEVDPKTIGRHNKWVTLAKGGDYSKYYYDHDLVVLWENNGEILHSVASAYIRNETLYFKAGVTYVYVTVKGFNVRYLPQSCIFAHKGPAVFLRDTSIDQNWYLLGYLNSSLVQFLLFMLTPSRSYEVGYVGALPFSPPSSKELSEIGGFARQAYEIKSAWDTGNELCTRFSAPWLVQLSEKASEQEGEKASGLADVLALLGDAASPHPLTPSPPLPLLLTTLRAIEDAADARLQALQAEIDAAVYDLYDITPADRALIERELGARPPELVWPQMERKSDLEKRREHVRRLLSYCLLRALQEKPDGLIPLCIGTGQPTVLDAVRAGLEQRFGETAAFKMETDIQQVLGRDLGDWLDGDFIKWHTQLYKKRPVIWQLCSSDPARTFNLFLYIHALDGDTLPKVRTQYLWPLRRTLEAARDTAQARETYGEVQRLETALDALAAFETRLQAVMRGDIPVETPPWAQGPYRNGIYDPILDDGVAVNLAPLQAAELLRYKKMV